MMDSSTLHIADRAPDFSLPGLNSQGYVSLQTLTRRGPAILEFIRGTW